jgi:S-adenosylmethionine synthetase
MSSSFVFSSESVGEGHPDKVADFISDSVLDACLEQDPNSRVACETLVKSNHVVLAGEITTEAVINYDAVAREAITEIGYVNDDDVFHASKVFITNLLTKQSSDIAQGVNAGEADGKETNEQGAGDQGLMFGYACNETPEMMPTAIMFAHRVGRELTKLRKSRVVEWLRPDAKSQVSIRYEDDKPVRIENVVISTQHTEHVKHSAIREFLIENVIRKVLPEDMMDDSTRFYINPTGRFVVGGPQGDSGLTGRKIIVDTYGGWGRHGGGAFSGKDPSKVDRSARGHLRTPARLRDRSSRAGQHLGRRHGHSQSRRAKDRRGRAAGLQFQTRRDHPPARSAPADLPQDDELRPLRQGRASLGADQPH